MLNAVYPTEKGSNSGITTKTIIGRLSEHTDVIFDKKAQQLIVENIGLIAEVENRDEYVAETRAENQGKVWSMSDEKKLIELYSNGFTVSEIAYVLKRSEGKVSAKLELYGYL